MAGVVAASLLAICVPNQPITAYTFNAPAMDTRSVSATSEAKPLRILLDTKDAGQRPQDSAEVLRSKDGLFYVDAVVNGANVRFLIDTGATSIVLTSEDAKRIGVTSDGKFDAMADTANGRTHISHVTLASLEVGPMSNRAVPAVVANSSLGVSLLGQSWLQQLGSITIEGDRMVLR